MNLCKYAAAMAAMVLITSAGQADDSPVCGCQKPASCMNHCSSQGCMLVCCAEVKTVKEKTHCWEVDCEYVCIPKVKCPSLLTLLGLENSSCLIREECGSSDCQGQCCQQSPQCGKVRTVRKLSKVESEKEKQVVEWSVKQCAIGHGKCCSGHAPVSTCAPQW